MRKRLAGAALAAMTTALGALGTRNGGGPMQGSPLFPTALCPRARLWSRTSPRLRATTAALRRFSPTALRGHAAAPEFSTAPDAAPYLVVEGKETETVALPVARTRYVDIYVGSLDAYNTISFGGPGAVSLTQAINLALTGAKDDGDQQSGLSNGLFEFSFAAPVTSVTFSSSENSLEVASVSSAVPEPSTWAMMLIGFTGLGYAAYRTEDQPDGLRPTIPMTTWTSEWTAARRSFCLSREWPELGSRLAGCGNHGRRG